MHATLGQPLLYLFIVVQHHLLKAFPLALQLEVGLPELFQALPSIAEGRNIRLCGVFVDCKRVLPVGPVGLSEGVLLCLRFVKLLCKNQFRLWRKEISFIFDGFREFLVFESALIKS